MAITHLLQPMPKWYFVALDGLPLGAGYLAVYSSLNHNIQKLVYQTENVDDPTPWPTEPIPNTSLVGVLIDENGTQGPFYFALDANDPEDRYFLIAYDKNGVEVWSQDNFPSIDDNVLPENTIGLSNLVVNNVFWRNIGATANPIASTTTMLAPSTHDGFALTSSNAMGDIFLIKNNTAATDQITFSSFGLGSEALAPDVTPLQYLNYTCTNTPVGETLKVIQIPLTLDINYLSGQFVTATLWARVNSGANLLTLRTRHFFGDGGSASADIFTNLGDNLTLTSSWKKFTRTFELPDISGKSIGEGGNTGLFLQIMLPLSAACNIDLTKPCFYPGQNAPALECQTESDITSVTDSARTGDVKPSFNYTSPNYVPGGWILVTGDALNDTDFTIGSASSGADEADSEYFPLYNLIWGGTSIVNCPIYTSAGVPTTKGVSSIADFSDNKRLRLPTMGGRALAGTCFNGFNYSKFFTANSGTNTLTVDDTSAYTTGQVIQFGTLSGGTLPSGLSPSPTNYYAIITSSTTLQVAATYDDAVAATPVVHSLVTNGSGSIFLTGIISQHALASYLGQDTHPQLQSEMPEHFHNLPPDATLSSFNGVPSGTGTVKATTVVDNTALVFQPIIFGSSADTGGGNPFNILQPTIYTNYLIKI